ncbi:Zinc finger protein VAR3, chloroplastic [Linum perenne]
MAVSRFSFFKSSFFPKPTVPRSNFFFPVAPFLSVKPLHFQKHLCSTATATATVAAESLTPHPWPEWVAFINRLKTKGYLLEAKKPAADDQTSEAATVSGKDDDFVLYRDMNQLKDACLSFGRDRYDILKLLSEPEIQTMVDTGCPNLLRKAVNSGKRLRAYLRLDEGDVCGVCNLRGSCDRAYVILKDSEAEARTVDLIRILMFYALDPLVISDGQRPAGRENVEVAARKLLSEMVELSEKTADPAPIVNPVVSKKVERKVQIVHKTEDKAASTNRSFGEGRGLSENVEMKRGDWMCSKCNFMNFARNKRCLKCSEEGPKSTPPVEFEMKKGDWKCTECSFVNFARNRSCMKCSSTMRPKSVGVNDVEMKKGDWNCPQCSFMNFASNKACLSCKGQRPKLVIGEWKCSSCGFFNYSRNAKCLKCKTDKIDPKTKKNTVDFVEESAADYEWKRPV